MELIQYVRESDGAPVGAVVALGKNQVGWSRKHRLDSWDRQKALKIARGRAVVGTGPEVQIPHDVLPLLNKMEDRSRKYFK